MSAELRNSNGCLYDVRVLELADQKGEFCGKLLAGAGADVIKVEPPGGSPTRNIGPFVGDVPNPERSLHYWHYNFGKRGITLDVTSSDGSAELKRLAKDVDVILESHDPGTMERLGLGYDVLRDINPGLIMASISPFGQTGPYRDYKSSDLTSLAMGGVMMLTGYEPDPQGRYDTPPIAPQMWHSSHVVGIQTYNAILAALLWREQSGLGQYIDGSMHRAINCNTGSDIPYWVFAKKLCFRQTARYGEPRMLPDTLAPTKDGRYIMAFVSAEFRIGREHKHWVEMMDEDGCAEDLTEPKYQELEYVTRPEVSRHIHAVARRWVQRYKFDREVWRRAQDRRLHWAPMRKPEENLDDPHWHMRHTFASLHHDEIGQTLTYSRAPWFSTEAPWRTGPKAPHLGEHNDAVVGKDLPALPGRGVVKGIAKVTPKREPSFAIQNVRILDLAWVVAGAAGPRILASLGAEDIRVEWKGRLDTTRTGGTVIPVGEEREARLRGEAVDATRVGVNQGGTFAEVNAGKRSISINLHHAEGKKMLLDLVRVCDVVVENYSAKMMDRLGVTYEDMRRANPTIIYVQQPGFGKHGLYQDVVSSAPVGEAFTGLTEQSGLPSPYPPAGWGYLYLDNSGSYYCAAALMSALYYRARTGKGQYIDSSLAEPALYSTGTAILDSQVNRRLSGRTGNGSPYIAAVPHGAYPCQGDDQWIAIAVFDNDQWNGLIEVLGDPEWMNDPRFETFESRIKFVNELETIVATKTQEWDRYDLMRALQARGVPAGVCQTTEDRVEHDPQLRHDGFQTTLNVADIGTWPMREFPIRLSSTPSHAGGILDRGAPCYAGDNDYVYGELLAITDEKRQDLTADEAI